MDLCTRIEGALYGGAIGDAMGAPVEGWNPDAIAQKFRPEDLRQFLPVTHKGDPATGKGAGRITDDTLMVEALILAYSEFGDHMDAYAYESHLLPQIARAKVWIPELQSEQPILNRLWWPEKYPWMRMAVGHCDPRQAGVGNCVNCGVAMWMMPVGAVNAGDPRGAYDEAADIGLAHNESFAVEAGAATAAAFAAAFADGADIAGVCRVAAELARDATGAAIAEVVLAAEDTADLPSFIANVRSAFEPYDQRTGHVSDDSPLRNEGISNVGRPSRLHAIEELPVALAALTFGRGDWQRTIEAAVFYGRDCDSIAGMACGLFGAVLGCDAIPASLRSASDVANRRNFAALAEGFCGTVQSILDKDIAVLDARRQAAGQ